MDWEVVAQDGRRVQVDAVDWMMAMAQATPVLGIEVSGWMCTTRPDGVVQVMDPMTGETWLVAPVGIIAPAPSVQYVPDPAAAKAATPAPAPSRAATKPPAPPIAAPEDAPAPTAPPLSNTAERKIPRLAPRSAPPAAGAVTAMWETPMRHSLPPQEGIEAAPPNLAETLFDASDEIYGAPNLKAACATALDVVMKLVPCEAGSVLRGSRDDGFLTFIACAGPAGEQLVGKKMYFGQGVVGASFDLGITIQVQDVASDARHLSRFDKETGFRTKSVLCTPLRSENAVYGAFELINPTLGRFSPWHVEVLETIGRQLAQLLSPR